MLIRRYKLYKAMCLASVAMTIILIVQTPSEIITVCSIATCKESADGTQQFLKAAEAKFNDFLLNTQRVQDKRKRQIARFCKTKANELPGNETRFNIYSNNEKVLYCFIPKVACTTWKRLFLAFDGRMTLDEAMSLEKGEVHKGGYLRTSEINSTEERDYVKNNYYSFMISRHPFERLVSAYRNKFQYPPDDHYMIKRYGTEILRMFRRNLTEFERKGYGVTFSEFINYIIVTGAKSNPHWSVMSKLCPPCHTNYDYIAKMETLVEDSRMILLKARLSAKYSFPENFTEYHYQSKEVMRRYFRSVTQDEIQRLYEIYKDDFDAFGYGLPKYMKKEK